MGRGISFQGVKRKENIAMILIKLEKVTDIGSLRSSNMPKSILNLLRKRILASLCYIFLRI